MKATAVLLMLPILFSAGAAAEQLAPGDRILVDVGQCWFDPAYPSIGPFNGADARDDPALAHGPNQWPAPEDGNFWNNHSANPLWGAQPIDLVSTDGDPTGMIFDLNPWSACGDGGMVGNEIAPINTPYPAYASTDCRWWDTVPGGNGTQPGYIYLTSLPTGLRYDIGLFGYVADDAVLHEGGPYPAGTTVYTVGAESAELLVMGNTTDVAWLLGLAPQPDGSITIELTGGTPDCGAVVNVVDITVVPEPATLLLLAGAAAVALRRRR